MKRLFSLIAAGLVAAVGPYALAQTEAPEESAVAGSAIPEALRGVELRALSLASADFDGDGIPDLAAGFGTAEGRGVIVLYRGNPDALYPHAPEARERLAQGRLVTSPFLPTDRVLALPAPPDFLVAGDFDADGRMDLAAATRGEGAMPFLPGDGHGAFLPFGTWELSGAVTALAAEDLARRDGLADLVVGVEDPAGSGVLLLGAADGARRAAPLRIALSETVSSLEIDRGAGARITLRSSSGAAERIEWSARSWRLAENSGDEPDEAMAMRTLDPSAAADLSLRVAGHAAIGRVRLHADGTLAAVSPAVVSTFLVGVTTNLDDAAPGNGVCADANGDCSLRAAIEEANAHAGADAISFAIQGGGVPAISVLSLPIVTETLTIDGTTQSAGRVMVTGTSNGTLLTLQADGCVVRGMVFNGTGNFGLNVKSSNNVIEGNFFGTTADGSALQGGISGPDIVVTSGSNNLIGGTTAGARNIAAGGTNGILLNGGSGTVIRGNSIGTDVTGILDLGNISEGVRIFTSAGNTVGGGAAGAGNLVSGNGAAGISLETDGNLVQGNRVGTDVTGTAALPNTTFGVHVYFSADNVVGGTAPGMGNLISGNGSTGLEIDSNAAANTLVQGNRIGTDAAGNFAIANQGYGVQIVGASQCTIGGLAVGAGNLISGNLFDGIFFDKFATVVPTGNVVQGNFIGTDATGTAAIPNLKSGIAFLWAENNAIGGTGPGEGNVISGNFLNGIDLDLTGNTIKNQIYGNRIGTNAFGTGPLGNRLSGVFIPLNTHGAFIGGTGAGQANTIAYNGGAGVASDGGRALHVAPNAIYDNGGLGLDLFDDGVTPNRPGATNNFPVVTLANDIGGGTSVAGYLDARAATSFDIHIFSSLSCDPSGHGEGREYRKTVPLTTDAAGHGVFTTTITPAIPGGRYVTAYAVAPGTADDTSEFSFCRQLTGGPPPDDVALALFAVSPATGGRGPVTVQIAGEGVVPGATARLERAGSPDIPASSVVVSASGTTATATFDLTAAATGLWDVTVDVPGDTATLAQAFTVSAATEPDVWADILGRGTLVVRGGRDQTFFLMFGNRGNVDAPPTELRVTIPRQLRVTFVEPYQGSRPVVTLDLPATTGGTGESTIHLYVPSIPASSSQTVAFGILTIEADPGEFGQEVHVTVWALSSDALAEVVDTPLNPNATLTTSIIDDTPEHLEWVLHYSDGVLSGDIHYEIAFSEAAFESSPVFTKTETPGELRYDFTGAVASTAIPLTNRPKFLSLLGLVGTLATTNPQIKQAVLGVGSEAQHTFNAEEASKIGEALANGLPPADQDHLRDQNEGTHLLGVGTDNLPATPDADRQESFDVMSAAGKKAFCDEVRQNPAYFAERLGTTVDEINAKSCDEIQEEVRKKQYECPGGGIVDVCKVPKIFRRDRPLRVFLAIDPNEKAGASGAGAAAYINGEEPIPYTITFENLETATAAAQEVLVTDQLDALKLDFSTFALGPIAFGTHVLAVPPGLTSFSADVDLRPGIDLIARVTAGFNPGTGLATWHFFSLDPATGQPTTDPLLGFLPPNVATPEGEGHVSFTIRAKSGLSSGTEIHNQASIVFDANPAIVTADWLNTIDVTPPASQVAVLPGSSCSGIAVSWSGTDAHSGIADYDVFVSENGGGFVPWRTETTATASVFYGTVGSTYAFYSVARDAAGNEEAPPASPDASTAVGSPTPLTDSLTPTSGPAAGASVTLTGSGFAAGASVMVGTEPASNVIVTGPTSLSATFPALAAGALYDVNTQNPGGCASTFEKAWLADFSDVPAGDPFQPSVEKIARHGVTVGCGGGLYCGTRPVTRAEMAVFLIKGKYNLGLTPPPETGTLFGDVHVGDFAADYIEQFANEGITVGCGNGNYCPNANITRAEMSVFLLKSEHGPLYAPPPATGTVFTDVGAGDFAAAWIEQIAAEGITAGCGDGKFCPNDPVTRLQMAVFLSLTFGF